MVLKPANLSGFLELERQLREENQTFYYNEFQIDYDASMLPHESPIIVNLIDIEDPDSYCGIRDEQAEKIINAYLGFQVQDIVAIEKLVLHGLQEIRDNIDESRDFNSITMIDRLIEQLENGEYLK